MRLIDADELLKKFCHGCPDNDNGDNCIVNHCADYDLAVTMPTVDAKPIKHGRWILNSQYGTECSECGTAMFEIVGAPYTTFEPNYCPNCGARMDEVGK